MGTNFYLSLPGQEQRHIGKRSAAGQFCWDCKVTLCKEGVEAIHYDGTWHDGCPKCGQTPAKNDGHAAKVELGFSEPHKGPLGGVRSTSSFTWAMPPDEARKACEGMPDAMVVIDEYDRPSTGQEFLTMLQFNCAIEYHTMIGADFS